MWTLKAGPSGLLLTLLLCLPVSSRAELDISDSGSPKNHARSGRSSTRFIILHTTEGEKKGALAKLRRSGEAHYLVDRAGHVSRIVDKNRVATHAGRSMWNGTAALDQHSIGIEVVGYHNRPVGKAQLRALRELISQLQSLYDVPDDRVLTHSMVAFGTPNRYHRRAHRGRKRCGMNLSTPEVRAALGLASIPSSDPDVEAGRLVFADPKLAQHLYGARAKSRASSRSRDRRPSVETHEDLIYVLPTGRIASHAELLAAKDGRRLLKRLPKGTRVLRGYENAGRISSRRPPSVICGSRWRDPSTLYRLPGGRLVPGNKVRATSLPKNTVVLIRRSM